MSAMSDADLLRRVRARDRAAAEELYDRHAARLYAVALRVTGDRDVAGRVLEEAFVALMNGAAPDGAGEGWLIGLVRDLSIDRQDRTAAPSVEGVTPTPRSLVEEAFFRGSGVPALAKAYGLTEADTRKMLIDGIRELRGEFGGRK